ncbi:PilZ domain-containing protein [Breznakiella homolactica]|uniref:PilZ domain-containing protein n=1 Tax=Breznakiella homolactica TaxID=2798577 RepID=A0A7T7XRF6_9SPIR|nr:PilZ domain-containing protein [Breznakiella homolactica]QQO11116.1 PilZ domain-containing protein [Breznakiella homolactica]
MATPIKRIEKDFLLKVLYDEQLPVMYLRDRTEYILYIEKPTKTEMFLKADRPIAGLKVNKKIELMFDYRGQIITFSIVVKQIKDDHIVAEAPEFLYKNLARSFSRVQSPQDLVVQFSFSGDRYSLSFPKIQEYEPEDVATFIENLDPRDLSGLIDQLAAWIKDYANGYKLIIFKDQKPSSTEERIVAETGKTLFIPITQARLPQADPYPKRRIITEDMFRRYLESTGVDVQYLDEAVDRFLYNKFEKNIFSDAWIPILFQEYVIGYIHIWINKEGKHPFDYGVIDTLYQFAKVLAFSLKTNGYFETGRIKDKGFEGKVIDISASGLLFAYPHSQLSSSLLPDSELSLKLVTPKRAINANARIVRRYKDNTMGYFGCRFLDIVPEDMRFLFEFIYGKPFTDRDANFITGQV